MDTPRSRLTRRRGSRTPFNPLKSIDNSMEIENIGLPMNNSEEHGIKIRTEPFDDHYIVENALGRGKFATVKKCVCKDTGRVFAAKFQRKRRKAKDARHELLHEVKMLALCKLHPRFVSIREVFETRNEMIIVTDYAEGGELYRHIEEREGGFSESDVRHLMRQTLEGLAYLHDRSVVHMDIKPQNILLSGSDARSSSVLLCDLGFSRDVTSGEDIREIIGTPDFVAPEILNYEPLTTRSDMWSAGILTYMLLSGYSPYAGDDKMETFSNISHAQLDFPDDWFENVSAQARDFISRLLVRAPSKRMSAHECLEHEWLQQEDNTTTAACDSVDTEDDTPCVPAADTINNNNNTTNNTSSAFCDSSSSSSDSDVSNSDDVTTTSSSTNNNTNNTNTDTHGNTAAVVKKSAISSISLELVKHKLEAINEQQPDCASCSTSNSTSSCECVVEEENCENVAEKCERDCCENESSSTTSSTRHVCSSLNTHDVTITTTTTTTDSNSDTTVQRKVLKELSNQRTASVVTSPMASPIGCRRQLNSSPETIIEIEPVKKHHCRRDASQVSLILKTDLHVMKVESKVWDLGEVVHEDNSAVVTRREKEVVVTS